MLFRRRKHTLSVREMIELEEKIKSIWVAQFGEDVSQEELSQKLKLKVEYVDPQLFDAHVDAELAPIADPDFNGLIRVNGKCKDKSFAYVHEIVHYVFDVGIGEKVTNVYRRMSKGYTKDEHDQRINYMTAAVSMPYEKVYPYIREYDESHPKMDELLFVDRLCKDFKQPRAVAIRRVQEVRRIKRYQAG